MKEIKTDKSSNIAMIQYNKEKTLQVTFKTGGVYEYLGVPERVFEAFEKADSFGRFFAKEIRGKYETRKL